AVGREHVPQTLDKAALGSELTQCATWYAVASDVTDLAQAKRDFKDLKDINKTTRRLDLDAHQNGPGIAQKIRTQQVRRVEYGAQSRRYWVSLRRRSAMTLGSSRVMFAAHFPEHLNAGNTD